jgi:inner membrane protein
MIILPVVLTLIMLGWHRWRGKGSDVPNAKRVLLLAAVGILTHPFLDWMNTYGMRWLSPLSGRWWYADTLFIVDPWIWLALTVGVWLSRKRRSLTPARLSLALVLVYIAGMGVLSANSRSGVRTALVARGITADTVVVEPVPANPVRRRVIYHWNAAYHLADYGVLRRALSEPWFSIPINQEHPAVARANETAAGREYHSWTRLPYYVVDASRDTMVVTIADARYTLDGRSSWAVTRIPVALRNGGSGSRQD